jgi:MFS family permease
LSQVRSFETAAVVYLIQAVAIAIVATPSLAYMADAISSGGIRSFGVAYGVYNFAWALGLLVGPAIGGFMYERLGLRVLSIVWAPLGLAAALIVARTRNAPPTVTGA